MRSKLSRIIEFEALRGFLAAWVLIGHVFKHSGYMPDVLRPLPLLVDPGMPVDVFIVLSGFVIFSLLDHKDEGYRAFITRRFFRLFPLFVVVLLVYAAVMIPALAWREAFPWKTPFLEGVIAINRATVDFLPTHFLVHLTMLHGLVPHWLLPFSEYAIVGQAWSISVEWQFYIVAPLLFFLLRQRPLVLGIVVLGLIVLHSRYWLGEGFALNQGQFFLIGIVSYYVYRNITANGPQIFLGASIAIAALYWISPRPTSLAIWVVALAAAMHAKGGGKNLFSCFSAMTIAQWLGRISYSVYLWHGLIIICLSRLILVLAPNVSQTHHLALLMASTLAGTLAISSASFTLVERPGMEVGRYFAKRSRSGGSNRTVFDANKESRRI